MEELLAAQAPEGVARQGAALVVQPAPEVEVRREVGGRVPEARVQLVGLLLAVGRPLARVGDRQRRGDHDDVVGAAAAVGLQDHAAEARVDRQAGQAAPELRERLLGLGIPGRELVQQDLAVAHLAAVGRVEEREVLDLAEVQGGHLQDDAGEVRAQDLRVGEARPGRVVLLGVQADGDTRRDPPAAAGALVGGGLRDRLDRQALDLQARAVAADARGPRVDHGADAGDGQRGLGDVGGEHHAGSAGRLEDALLLGVGEARVEREQLDLVAQPGAQGVLDVADLALAREEDKDVAAALGQQLLDGVADGVLHVAFRLIERRVAHRDGVAAALDGDDRRVVEVGGHALDVDRGGGDHDLEVGPSRQDALEVAEQEVDVEGAFVGLVDDHGVVPAQQTVAADLREQQAVGQQADAGRRAGEVVEAHCVADLGTELHPELVGDALGDAAGGQAPGLGVGDALAAQLEAELGQLRGLAAAGLAGHHHDLVVADRRAQVVQARGDRQLGRILHLHPTEGRSLSGSAAAPRAPWSPRRPCRAGAGGSRPGSCAWPARSAAGSRSPRPCPAGAGSP